MTQMGLTPISQIARALAMGIQQLTSDILALLAKLKVGAAMRATTAGRMPRKMESTTALSWKLTKNMAISSIIRKEGRAVPKADKHTHIDGKHTGATLGYRDDIEKILTVNPLVLVYHFGLYQGYHGIPATDGKRTDAEECLETVPIETVHVYGIKNAFLSSGGH